jgi:magnesium chelatase family protein
MNYAIAFGAYLVGLTARVVCVRAVINETNEFKLGEPVRKGETDMWKETRIRVRAALSSVGLDHGFTITFDHMPPRGSGLDLAIFAACLGVLGKLPADWFVNHNHIGAKLFFGELSFNGEVRPVRGVLPLLMQHETVTESLNVDSSERQFVIPNDCAEEASHADPGTNVYAIKHVSELFDLPAHTVARREYKPIEVNRYVGDPGKLPARVVRVIEIAAIGRHSIHFIGSLAFKAARLLCDLLPPMTRDEAIESACMYSIAGLLRNGDGCGIGIRSFRAPHHTVSVEGLVGGGSVPRPGELSLAHHGVLYLDGLPEFKRGAIEPLATFLREGRATIVRASNKAEFSVRTLLVTGCTRCPCDTSKEKHSEYCAERKDRKIGDEHKESFYLGWQRRHVTTLGIQMIVDTDFADDDKPCQEDVQTLRRWVACAVEFGQQDGLSTVDLIEYPHTKLARTIANREGHIDILVEDLEKAAVLAAR